MHRTATTRSEEKEMIVGSVAPFYCQHVKNMVKIARVNAEPRECPRGAMKPDLRGFYYRLVFRGNEVLDCAVLREMILTARKLLSSKALN